MKLILSLICLIVSGCASAQPKINREISSCLDNHSDYVVTICKDSAVQS